MFVVFEGIDGSGKTTLSNKVAATLDARGMPVRHIRADGKYASRVSEAIRELGRDARNLALVPEAEMLLYVARDVQLIEEVVRPALRDGDVVIADRFKHFEAAGIGSDSAVDLDTRNGVADRQAVLSGKAGAAGKDGNHQRDERHD